MKALLDTNIILDLFLNNQPFVVEAQTIWDANEQGKFEGYVSAITPINLFYIGRKFKGRDQALKAVEEVVKAFQVCQPDKLTLQTALALLFKDYEDAFQHASATLSQLDCIVTRDLKDYANATLPIYSPADFLKLIP